MADANIYAENWDYWNARRILAIACGVFFIFALLMGGVGIEKILGIVALLIFYVFLFLLFRERYTVEFDRLIIRRYFKDREIMYTSIRRIEKMSDINKGYKYDFSTWKSIEITYIDINGKEKLVIVSPGKIKEFYSDLESKLPDPIVIKKKQDA